MPVSMSARLVVNMLQLERAPLQLSASPTACRSPVDRPRREPPSGVWHMPRRCQLACLRRCLHTCLHAWVYTFLHAWVYTCLHAWVYTCLHAWVYTCLQLGRRPGYAHRSARCRVSSMSSCPARASACRFRFSPSRRELCNRVWYMLDVCVVTW